MQGASVSVSTTDLAILGARAANPAVSQNEVLRARILLLSADGLGVAEISAALDCTERTVARWLERYRDAGIAGLRDAPRPGRPVRVREIDIIERTLTAPPGDRRRWSSRLLAADLGISNVSVANVWRTWGVRPVGTSGDVALAAEPAFEGRVRSVPGLHLTPRARALAMVTTDGVAPMDHGEPGTAPDDRYERSLPGFLDLVAGAAGRARPGTSVRLLVDGPTAPLMAAADPRVPVHVVAPGQSWSRVATIAVASASPGMDGHRLLSLRDALEDGDPQACRVVLATR